MAETIDLIVIFWILPISGIPIPRSTAIQVSPHELLDINVKEILDNYTSTITAKLGNTTSNLVVAKLASSKPRKVESIDSAKDLWEGGDINMLPYEPTSEI